MHFVSERVCVFLFWHNVRIARARPRVRPFSQTRRELLIFFLRERLQEQLIGVATCCQAAKFEAVRWGCWPKPSTGQAARALLFRARSLRSFRLFAGPFARARARKSISIKWTLTGDGRMR